MDETERHQAEAERAAAVATQIEAQRAVEHAVLLSAELDRLDQARADTADEELRASYQADADALMGAIDADVERASGLLAPLGDEAVGDGPDTLVPDGDLAESLVPEPGYPASALSALFEWRQEHLDIATLAQLNETCEAGGTGLGAREAARELTAAVRRWTGRIQTTCSCIEMGNVSMGDQPTDDVVAGDAADLSGLVAALSQMSAAIGIASGATGEEMAAVRAAMAQAASEAVGRVRAALASAKDADEVRDERVTEALDELEGEAREVAEQADDEARAVAEERRVADEREAEAERRRQADEKRRAAEAAAAAEADRQARMDRRERAVIGGVLATAGIRQDGSHDDDDETEHESEAPEA